jgi:hypothetical protein
MLHICVKLLLTAVLCFEVLASVVKNMTGLVGPVEARKIYSWLGVASAFDTKLIIT